MGGPQSARPAAGKDPAGREELLILLASPPSAAERALVTRWLRDGGIQPAAVLPLNGPGLARSLDQAVPETVVTAVRVTWLPRERGGEQDQQFPAAGRILAGRGLRRLRTAHVRPSPQPHPRPSA